MINPGKKLKWVLIFRCERRRTLCAVHKKMAERIIFNFSIFISVCELNWKRLKGFSPFVLLGLAIEPKDLTVIYAPTMSEISNVLIIRYTTRDYYIGFAHKFLPMESTLICSIENDPIFLHWSHSESFVEYQQKIIFSIFGGHKNVTLCVL
jgi:hypothetical protein